MIWVDVSRAIERERIENQRSTIRDQRTRIDNLIIDSAELHKKNDELRDKLKTADAAYDRWRFGRYLKIIKDHPVTPRTSELESELRQFIELIKVWLTRNDELEKEISDMTCVIAQLTAERDAFRKSNQVLDDKIEELIEYQRRWRPWIGGKD